MHTVSYIIETERVTSEQLRTLSRYAEAARKVNVFSEYVIYPGDSSQSLPYVSLVSPASGNVSAAQKAVASTSGAHIVLTSLENALNDQHSLLARQASECGDYNLTVPMQIDNTVVHKAGIRLVRDVRYLIAMKDFIAQHSDVLNDYDTLIKQADKQLSLKFDRPVSADLPDVIVPSLTFTRPLLKVVGRRIEETKRSIKASQEKRKADELAKQVPPVEYSADMPVFIVCRDRVEPLKKLIHWCEDEGLTNIILIDNASTYRPLLDYFAKSKHEVIKLQENIGHTSPWASGAIDIYAKNRPFIVTDPDVIPDSDAHGAVKLFCELLSRHPIRRKVGFGLKIDDLPDHYELKKHVIAWEKQFWVSKVEDDVFDAEIDTTFAVYRAGTPYVLGPGLRTGGRFVARHEPWYVNSSDITKEVAYYRKHANKTIGTWGSDESDVSDVYMSNAAH